MIIKKTTGTFASFDGTEIYYEIRGEGKPLIFCYGIGCLFNHWHHQIDEFSKNYMTIQFDYRAHHKSEIPEDPSNINIPAIAKDIDALMKHLDLKKASFWGHSFGAQVLLKTYDDYPEYFESLVFVNGFIANPIQGMFGGDFSTNLFKIVRGGHDKLPATLSFLFKKGVSNPLIVPLIGLAGGFNLSLTSYKDIEVYASGVASLDLSSFITMFESMMEYNGESVLEKISIPTLIISGEKDNVTPFEHQKILHEKIKNSELHLVPQGSHCTQLDLPEYVNLLCHKFLEQHK